MQGGLQMVVLAHDLKFDIGVERCIKLVVG